jgi:putative hydrolase of the HAD superfamily
MLPKGILFDLDDTIIAYSSVAGPVWQRICLEFSEQYDLCDADLLLSAILEVSQWYWSDRERHRVGRSDLNKARRDILSRVFRRLQLNESYAWDLADAFSKKRETAVYMFEKARETLEYFNRKEVLLAMMTNGESHKQRNKIERFGLEKYFNAILIEGEMGFGKPEEAVYRKALNKLELKPKDVWAVGDNLEWDVGAPQKIGIFGIWNDYDRKGLPPGSDIIPDRIIHNISELIPTDI